MTAQHIKILMVVVAFAALAYIVPHSGSFVILLATRALAFAILVMSVDILLGFTGLASLGQAAYLGVGAYLTAILATKFHFGLGWDFWLVVVLGILIGAALAAVFGLLAIRASGVYFLMITLALGQCVWGLAYRWNSLTGGDNGINLAAGRSSASTSSDEVTFFYLVFAFFAASLLALYVLVRSPFGRSLAGIRERELRMQILGYNTWLHKYIAFIIAGGFGGLSGVLWAHTAGHRQPGNVVLTTSVDALLMVVLGGAGTLVGGVDRHGHRVRPARISLHAGAVVAVRARWRLRADDPLSADGLDGHSIAHAAAFQVATQDEDSANSHRRSSHRDLPELNREVMTTREERQ